MFHEIWKWDETEKRIVFDRAEARAIDGFSRVEQLVEEAARWRRLYESKMIECARLQKELEKRNG